MNLNTCLLFLKQWHPVLVCRENWCDPSAVCRDGVSLSCLKHETGDSYSSKSSENESYVFMLCVQGGTLWRLPSLQQHRASPRLPSHPDGTTPAGAQRQQRAGHGRLDAAALPVRLQRGKEGDEHAAHAVLFSVSLSIKRIWSKVLNCTKI